MHSRLASLALACMLAAHLATAADSKKGGPVIRHVPVTTATRGIPVTLVCTIESQAGLSNTITQIRITDLGKPQDLPLKGKGKGHYESVVPVPLIAGIDAFWYSLSAYDKQGKVSSTHWQRVHIVDAATGGATPFWRKPIVWLTGGTILAAGGTAAIIANNDGDNNSAPPPPPPPAPAKRPPAEEEKPAPCTLKGSERVNYGNRTVFNQEPIVIFVCQTCPDATISASGSWNASDQITNFNNPDCTPNGPFLHLPKPIFRIPPPPGTYTIEVRSNGGLIDSSPWPDNEASIDQ